MKLYHYVGPRSISERIRTDALGAAVRSASDVLEWVRITTQGAPSGIVIATFVVDETGLLRIADRRSEHVACAGGQPVRSAGEITFSTMPRVEVTAISNQSTGYCPEPESWPAVSAALVALGMTTPQYFTSAYEFRRCTSCDSIALIKNAVFECSVCGAALPENYNCQP